MARTSLCPETVAVDAIPANKPGNHGGISIANGRIPDAPAQGSSGNPGTENPWEGSDSTAIGANSALPPLTHLGG